jgi:hypothetical protein
MIDQNVRSFGVSVWFTKGVQTWHVGIWARS